MSHTHEHHPERSSVLQHTVRCIVSILLLAAGGTILWLTVRNRGQETLPADDGDGIPVVQTVAVLPHEDGFDIQVDGIVTPFREIQVAAEVGGKIALKGPLVHPRDIAPRAPALIWKDTATEDYATVGEDFVTKEPAFREGDFISENTVLVVIDQQDYQLELQRSLQQAAQVDAELAEVEAERENVASMVANAERDWELSVAEETRMKEAELKRVEENRPSGVFSASEFDQVQKAILASENAKQTLQNQLNSLNAREARLMVARQLAETATMKAEYDLKRTVITAPCDGVIVKDFVEAGSYVQKGTALFVIEDISSVEVRCNLKMEDLYWLLPKHEKGSIASDSPRTAYQIPETSASVTYQMAGRSDLQYTWAGKLTRYDGIGLDERTRTVPCRIVVSNPLGDSKSDSGAEARRPVLVRGMYVNAQVRAADKEKLFKIPAAAVQPGKWVWRVRGGKLQKIESLPLIHYVPDAADGDYWLVPAAGSKLTAGDRLVVTPMIGMRDGMQVRDNSGESVPELAGSGR